MVAEDLFTPDYHAQWAAWVNQTGTLVHDLANEIASNPSYVGIGVENVAALHGYAAGLQSVKTPDDLEGDKAVQLGVVIAVIAAILAVAAIVYVSQQTLQDLINHTNATARLAMVNSCLANARTEGERRQCVEAAQVTRPEPKPFPWLLLGIGAVAIGAGYWYYTKRKGLSEFEEDLEGD
jgi:hypothetical protein